MNQKRYERTRPELGDVPDIRIVPEQLASITIPLGKLELRLVGGLLEVRIFSEVLEGEPVVFPAKVMEHLAEVEALPEPICLDTFEVKGWTK